MNYQTHRSRGVRNTVIALTIAGAAVYAFFKAPVAPIKQEYNGSWAPTQLGTKTVNDFILNGNYCQLEETINGSTDAWQMIIKKRNPSITDIDHIDGSMPIELPVPEDAQNTAKIGLVRVTPYELLFGGD